MNKYAAAVLTVGFAGLLSSCSPDRGKAELTYEKGADGAPDKLLFHEVKRDVTHAYVVMSDTDAIKAKSWEVVLREDNFNGGFFVNGITEDGKDYFDAHYDAEARQLNDVLSKAYIRNFSWNDGLGRDIYLKHDR